MSEAPEIEVAVVPTAGSPIGGMGQVGRVKAALEF
jgi:isoquinoline 1-oxidoreductase subunit beta